MSTKFIFVTGGVVSSLGKGLTAASIGMLLEHRGLKVAICGQVFDVTKGAEFYAKGAGYGFFAGRDASLAFATGNFKTNLTDNVDSPASFFERRVDGVPWRLDVCESIASTASRWNRSATMAWRAREIDGVER